MVAYGRYWAKQPFSEKKKEGSIEALGVELHLVSYQQG